MQFPIIQLLLNSLIIGSIYALVAVGFSIIYQTNRFMHFAHGGAVVASAYLAFLFFSILKIPFFISVILTIASSCILGLIMYKLIYEPLRKKKSSNIIMLIASFGILMLVENIILLSFGSDMKSISYVKTQQGINIFGATITSLQIFIIIITVIILVITYWFMNKTNIGRNLRAVADNKELADIIGLNSNFYISLSFIIGSVLAAIAGILIGLEQSLSPTIGTNLMIKGFSGAVIGGVTSVPASIVGSYIIGFAENFGVWFVPSGFKDAITFILLLIFLLFKPSGLFGVDRGGRK